MEMKVGFHFDIDSWFLEFAFDAFKEAYDVGCDALF